MSDVKDSRAELEVRANAVRSRLLRVVRELNRRGHDAVDLKLQVRRHWVQVVIGGAVLIVATAGAIGLSVHRAAERRRAARGGILRGRWRRPAAVVPRRRGFFAEVFRSVAIATVTACALIPVRRFAAQLAARPATSPPPH
jgi:hypothetical protein